MAIAGVGRRVSLALDPVLVPAGFQGGQYGDDRGGDDLQIIFCAGHDELSERYPQLPQAHQQRSGGTCVDLVVDIRADGRLDRIDLEGTSLDRTLHHVGLLAEGDAVAQVMGGAVDEALPVLETALVLLLSGLPMPRDAGREALAES